MIRHIVWWTLKDHAEGRSASENAAHLQKASAALHDIPSARHIEVSAMVQPTTTVPAQVVLMGEYEDMAALEAYNAHPIHKEFATIVKAVADTRSCIDYVTE